MAGPLRLIPGTVKEETAQHRWMHEHRLPNCERVGMETYRRLVGAVDGECVHIMLVHCLR